MTRYWLARRQIKHGNDVLLYTSSGIQDRRGGVSKGWERDVNSSNESTNLSLVFTFEF